MLYALNRVCPQIEELVCTIRAQTLSMVARVMVARVMIATLYKLRQSLLHLLQLSQLALQHLGLMLQMYISIM